MAVEAFSSGGGEDNVIYGLFFCRHRHIGNYLSLKHVFLMESWERESLRGRILGSV